MPSTEVSSLDDLVDYVCERMPLRARIMGRPKVAEIVEASVQNWPAAYLTLAEGDEEAQRTIIRDMKDHIVKEKRYGFSILILWGIGIIINLIWQWWLSRSKNRQIMGQWKDAMEAGS